VQKIARTGNLLEGQIDIIERKRSSSLSKSYVLIGSIPRKHPMQTPPKPNIVLVHGAWADGSSWGKVISLLAPDGYNIVAVQNSMASLSDDVANTRRVIDAMPGQTIVVGHSYGGAVITGAAAGATNVVGLVYLAAYALEAGEALGQVISQFPQSPGRQHIQPDAAGFAYFDRAHFSQLFAPDVAADEAIVMAAVQKPISGSIFGEPVGAAAWHQIPAWYQVSTDDQVIHPDLQRWMADRMGAKTIELNSSHASILSHTQAIAAFIREAAEPSHWK
jgi:pimeloyl-ACP methyl ester carboxylesterase